MKAFALAHPVITTLAALSVLGTVAYTWTALTWRRRQQP